MPKIAYQEKRFSALSLAVIERANSILETYALRTDPTILTLRQLYYQFVARGWIDNNQKEYKRLGNIINDARMAGEIDWDHLQDRTRNLSRLPHWNDPGDVIESAAASYHRDLRAGQECYVEVMIEKDALVGVIENVCTDWDVPFFSCRGYSSQSEMWGAGQRLVERICDGQNVRVIHLGDHDPSGLDMSRDIRERLTTFVSFHIGHDPGDRLEVHRVALNIDQVRRYNPPPNPAKPNDSRYRTYARQYGSECWELDALGPDVLIGLISEHVRLYLDEARWKRQRTRQDSEREVLNLASRNWPAVASYLKRGPGHG
jgi:hypothetical protein